MGRLIGKKRGRPKKYLAKDKRLEIRLDPTETFALESAAKMKGISKTEIIRRALKYYYSVMKYID